MNTITDSPLSVARGTSTVCRVTIAAVLLYFAVQIPVLSSPVSTHFNFREVAQGIYVHQGKIHGNEHPQRDDIANIGAIIGDDCIAIIDTGGSPAVGARLKQAIRAISDRDICYVINTHIHFDHLLGNAAFADGTVRFVGHENLAPSVEQNRSFFQEQYAGELGNGKSNRVIGPDLVVADNMKLDLGNRTLNLIAHGPAHTFTDLSVYDERTRTLWLSDLLFREHIPVLDGKLKGWLSVLDQLEQIPARRVIPGHGPVAENWPEAGRDQRHYLETLRDEVRRGIAEGRFMEDIIDNTALDEAAQWRLHEDYHRRNVSKAFTELEWE